MDGCRLSFQVYLPNWTRLNKNLPFWGCSGKFPPLICSMFILIPLQTGSRLTMVYLHQFFDQCWLLIDVAFPFSRKMIVNQVYISVIKMP